MREWGDGWKIGFENIFQVGLSKSKDKKIKEKEEERKERNERKW